MEFDLFVSVCLIEFLEVNAKAIESAAAK